MAPGINMLMRMKAPTKYTTFSLLLDSTKYPADPTGCWSYGDDAVGYTPMSNTNTSLGTVSDVGSWGFDTNPLFKKMYYATFNTDGTIAEILNPNDLTLTKDGAASSITSKNTMLVIPTLYTKGETGKFTVSDDPSKGTAYAHTFNGHIYDNLAISVYNCYVNSRLWSISNQTPTKSHTRANFRTYAEANGTGWMLWNYYAWRLMWMLVTLAGKSTNSQAKIAYGGHAYGSNATGDCNAMGPFAGSLNSGSAMKFLIEDWWCSQHNFIDDFYGSGNGTYYAGQNLVPTDDTANKTAVITGLTSGYWYGNTISQGDRNFGISSASGGSTSTGLCDGQYGATYSATLGYVGGGSGDGRTAGPSCFRGHLGLSGAGTGIGARLAFVFDN